jgi:hypothetical protein
MAVLLDAKWVVVMAGLTVDWKVVELVVQRVAT